jgi:hypothetical protein
MVPTPTREALRRRWDRFPLLRKVVMVTVVCPALMMLTATAAYADGSTAPSSLSWMEIEDSHGISIWKYELSLDRGGVTDAGKLVWSVITEWMWQFYRGYVAVAIWIIDWVLGFAWLATIADPVMSLGDSLTVVVDRFGLPPVLLTITALAAVTWMMRGRWVLGVFELFLSLLIASLAVGALANPVGLVAGKDGLLIQSRDLGLAVSAGLVDDGDISGSPDELREQVTATLADTFIRQPTQLLNFGEVVDGGDCEDTYDDVVQAGPYGTDDDIRTAMGDCEDRLGEVAENPNAGMAMSAGVLYPAAFIVLLFAIILAGTVLVASVQALYRGVKLIVDLVLGLLPGSARGGLWMSVADLVMALVTVVFATVFLTGYLLLIQAVFAAGGTARMQTFFAVDTLLVVGIVVFWRGRGRIKAASERLAHALAKRPGAGPSNLPARGKFSPAEAYYKGRMALGAAKVAGSGVRAVASGGAALAAGAGGVAGAAGRATSRPVTDSMDRLRWAGAMASRRKGAAGQGAGRPAAGTPPSAEPTAAQRVHHRIGAAAKPGNRGQLVRLGTSSVLAATTGGTSTLVTTAVRQAFAASATRRAALARRMRPAGELPPGPSGRGSVARGPDDRTAGGRAGMAARGGSAPARGSAPSGGPAGYDRVETDGTVTLVPHRPAAVPPMANSGPAMGGADPAAAARLRARLEARRSGAIALPGPARPTPP